MSSKPSKSDLCFGFGGGVGVFGFLFIKKMWAVQVAAGVS